MKINIKRDWLFLLARWREPGEVILQNDKLPYPSS